MPEVSGALAVPCVATRSGTGRTIRVCRSRACWEGSKRFAFGARLVLPVACGTAHVPVGIYLIGSGISSLVWSVLFVLIGWAFGESAMLALGQIRRYEDEIAAGLVAVVALMFAIATWRRLRRERRQ